MLMTICINSIGNINYTILYTINYTTYIDFPSLSGSSRGLPTHPAHLRGWQPQPRGPDQLCGVRLRPATVRWALYLTYNNEVKAILVIIP